MPAARLEARVHATLPGSRSNGPGRRNVVWFQGCSRRCPGCFNPETHLGDGGRLITVEELAAQLLAESPNGISISGGEPLEQPEALLGLLQILRARAPALSILLFSGFTLAEARQRPQGTSIIELLDVLVAGPYVESLHMDENLISSSNQQLHLLSSRHCPEDFTALPRTEVILHPDGTLTMTGFTPLLCSER